MGYIPQSIYLADNTIKSNIAFGIPDTEIDEDKVWSALSLAQLKGFVRSLPNGLETVIGEHGTLLSGGQRQRIGNARAIYHEPKVLIMDEATAALDNETERAFMEGIDGLRGEKTTLLIAHRLSTVKNCDIIFFPKRRTTNRPGEIQRAHSRKLRIPRNGANLIQSYACKMITAKTRGTTLIGFPYIIFDCISIYQL
jgi:ABC-type multidrug transport system fused ATPase/permease subunit